MEFHGTRLDEERERERERWGKDSTAAVAATSCRQRKIPHSIVYGILFGASANVCKQFIYDIFCNRLEASVAVAVAVAVAATVSATCVAFGRVLFKC